MTLLVEQWEGHLADKNRIQYYPEWFSGDMAQLEILLQKEIQFRQKLKTKEIVLDTYQNNWRLTGVDSQDHSTPAMKQKV